MALSNIVNCTSIDSQVTNKKAKTWLRGVEGFCGRVDFWLLLFNYYILFRFYLFDRKSDRLRDSLSSFLLYPIF
jgi:hypothetical protein